ncbi:MAG: GGDEF domain-containing protein [Clostridiales Family XIII bacterium]|jgi:diguanylate cyclase (GGDEF)-like protein|nr:GGDEF domain-containing protein [Clostridiales Family XIII bacterium]
MSAPELGNLSFNNIIKMISTEITRFLNDHESIYFWVPFLVFVIAVVFLLRAIYGKRKKALENSAYIIYCSFATALAFCSVVNILYGTGGNFAYVGIGAYAVYVSLPAIFCLHIWTQVNYKKINIGMLIGYFAIPAFLTIWTVKEYLDGVLTPDIWNVQSMLPLQYTGILFIGYWTFMMIRSYVLCFNVFYQMPRHMKASTGILVSALTVMVVEGVFALLINKREMYLLYLLALAFVLERSFAGFFRASASNVIATSREFVFSNLSTMILVLSRKHRILEWNRSPGNFVFKLVPPKYRQPFSDYRAKLLKAGHGVVSNHDKNIVTVTHDGLEHHLLITPAAIREGDREFGQLIEIADITHIYSVLRYIESIANFDQLTGLYNRNAYLDKASTIITMANMPLLIIVGDVNTLKLVNDNVGHIAGDRLLTTISGIVKEYAPDNAFVARIGGDEIAVLVPNADADVAETFVENVRNRTNSIVDPEFGTPDISLGWAVARSVYDDYNDVFKDADRMMYKEKRAYKEAKGISLSGALPLRREQVKATNDAPDIPHDAPPAGKSGQPPEEPKQQAEAKPETSVAASAAAPSAQPEQPKQSPAPPEPAPPVQPELKPEAPTPLVQSVPKPEAPVPPVQPAPKPEASASVMPPAPKPVAPAPPVQPAPVQPPAQPEPPTKPTPPAPSSFSWQPPQPEQPTPEQPASEQPASEPAKTSSFAWKPPTSK